MFFLKEYGAIINMLFYALFFYCADIRKNLSPLQHENRYKVVKNTK